MKTTRAAALTAGLVSVAFAASPATKPVFGPWGVTLADMDTSVSPGSDFFRYTNGGWLKTAVIPPDRQFAGVNLELDKENEARLKSIVAGLAAKPEAALSAEERKLRDLYNAFENTRAIDAAGLEPVKPDLERIAALKTYADVAAFMGSPASQVSGPFDINIDIDEKNPDAYVILLSQSGLGMPDRDYYLLKDKDSAATREAYHKYLTAMLAFAGVHEAERSAAVYALEERIARVHWPAAERREAEKVYNPLSLSALAKFAPQFPWDSYLAAAGVSRRSPRGERVVVVREKSAFPKLAAVFAATPVPVWRDYLTVRYLHSHASYLPTQIDDADFAFYGVVIGGQKQQLPRDLRGIHMLDRQMGEALGKLYVACYFPPEAKAKIQQLVANLLKAYEADIGTLTWMTPATKQKALEKIRRFTPKVGYPDRWRDYSALTIVPGELVRDATNTVVFEWNRELKRIDTAVDRGEWDMTPPTNNAYYNPTLNEIVFPAGILQPPYFDPNADDAVNYGEIGATIGHEISHGFDDQGSKYDATGRLNNWWTAEDRRNFDARTAALAKQYDQYQPLPGLHVNGRLTLGENIADLAGLVIASKAYHIALGGKPAPVLSGFTGDQRFYIAYGQSWREVWTDGLTRRIVLSNPHSPSKYRVNGVVRNDNGWYAAFPQIKSGDTYYLTPAERVQLW
ncbi:MAG TPA: M13 family metallopeptidase [Steroidobacteraceae bacterium]|jgi:putative endopeptidase|nr:M13 family metallopeptidase [Steroidobacteraceae bacterium]